MDTQYIKEFVILAECLSFSEAAEQLFISQSSLSKHIKALEKEFGQTFFNRTTRNIELSDAGRIFLHYASEIVVLWEDNLNALETYSRRRNSSVTLAVFQNPEYYNLASYVVGFRQAHPEFTLNLIEEDENGMLSLYHRKQVNLFATFEPEQPSVDYSFFPMVENSVYALLNESNPLSKHESLTLEDLRGERLLLPRRNSTISRIILGAFDDAGIAPDIFYEGSSSVSTDLVKAGMGTSLHSREFAAALSQHSDLVLLPIEPPILYRYGIAYRNLEELSAAERSFLEHARAYSLE